MKFYLSLTILCFSIALCHGACSYESFEGEKRDGCVDPFDGKKYPFGSGWDTANCLHCDCAKEGMGCCTRYGGVVHVEGCTAVVDPETCKYKFYKEGDPSQPCL